MRSCEDRGLIHRPPLRELFEERTETVGTNTMVFLKEEFKHYNIIFDSDLFRPQEWEGNLAFDFKVVRNIVLDTYNPYQFDVIPLEVLGNIYEQYLGYTIRLTDHQVKYELKPEVRKAGGVYYTPEYIVDYIVKDTVGKLLQEFPPRKITKLRILDPACGSGSFLIRAYEEMLNYYRSNMKQTKKSAVEQEKLDLKQEELKPHLTIQEKSEVLRNHIFGVDIDEQAAEVTKLSLMLKMLEGEYGIVPGRAILPKLDKNIKCGNSLISGDTLELQKYFGDEWYKVKPFNWDEEFKTIIEEEGGFDAVIGNPPYVVLGNDLYPESILNYLNHYTVAQYKTDLFQLFIQRGVELLNLSGKLGYIVPSPWLTLKFTDQLRKYLLERTSILEVVVFDHLVFPSTNVHTALLFLENHLPKSGHLIRVKTPYEAKDLPSLESTSAVFTQLQNWVENEGFRFETRLVGNVAEFVTKLISKWPSLEKVARASLGCQAYNSSKHTPEQIANRVFHSDHKAGPEYLPELAGNDVSKYLINRKRGQWIKYGPWLHDYRTRDWLQGPRILVREIAGAPPNQIQACDVEEPY